MDDRERLIEIINNFFGCDASYFGVHPYDLATHLLENGVTLYNSQRRAEIEALINGQETLQKHIAEKNAEIERLKVELEFKCDNCENIRLSRQEYRTAISQAKAEAIKEFAERLKNLPSVINCEYEWVHSDIDNLAKEMTEQ